jgi:predicted permease
MTGVLAADELNQAAGYLALFMVGWTPALWTVGYRIISSGDADEDSRSNATRQGLSWLTLADWFESIMNPPLYGVLVGVLVGGTPLSQFCLPVVAESAVGMEATTGAVMMLHSVAAGILRPIFEAATLLGTATMAVQTVVLASSLAASMPSLKAKGSSSSNKTSTTSGVVGNPLKDALRTTDASAGARPEPLLDRRAFWVISSVRLIAMPVVGIIMTTALQCARVLPVDPIFNLTVLAEAAMPSAQNLVLLSQLRASTQPLAGMLANLLLSQYALSVVPITLWMAVFLTLVRGS